MIPEFAAALWFQLKKGQVDVNEQELFKARDVRYLLEKGLIRVVRGETNHQLPTVGLVLSEEGVALKQKELNV